MQIRASGSVLRDCVVAALLSLCMAFRLSAAPISVTASGGPGIVFSSTAATFVDVLAPATVRIGMGVVCGGVAAAFPADPSSCVENVQPGIYELSASLDVHTTFPFMVETLWSSPERSL